MRNLYIHCGLPKTGTTSLQMFLREHREQLNAIDYDYPALCLNRGGYNHSNLSRQFSRHNFYDSQSGTADDFLNLFKSPDRKSNIIISAEGLASCLVSSDSSAKLQSFLRSAAQLNDAVYLIFSFRTFWRYIESLYLQLLKAGNLKVTLTRHIDMRLLWLGMLFKEIAILHEIVGAGRILVADVDQSDSISALLPLMKINESELGPRPEKLNARLGIKKAALLYHFQFESAGKQHGRSQHQIMRLAKSLEKMADLPDDDYYYHIVTFEQANRIQEFVRGHIPDFLSAQLESACRAVDTSHETAVLRNIQLTIRDALTVVEGLIPVEGKRSRKRSQAQSSA